MGVKGGPVGYPILTWVEFWRQHQRRLSEKGNTSKNCKKPLVASPSCLLNIVLSQNVWHGGRTPGAFFSEAPRPSAQG